MGLFEAAAFANPVALIANASQVAGAYMTNQSNEKISSDMADRNQSNAREQMAFQKDMSNTAHQREVADLKAAGLNPILSAGGSGSSTPTGASSSGSAATLANPLEGMAGNVMQMMKTNADLKYTEALTNKANTEEKVISKGIPEADMKNKMYNAVKPIVNKISEMTGTAAKIKIPTPKSKVDERGSKDWKKSIMKEWGLR